MRAEGGAGPAQCGLPSCRNNCMPETVADTCRIYVLPKLYGAGWADDQIQEQHSFTDGRIVPAAKKIRRLKQKRADYRLRYTRDFPIAVVEAKASYKSAGDGLQQAKEYAEILDLKFAYATNGKEIIEFDPKDKTFAPFGDARWKITGRKISKGREIYFAIYQAIAEDENRPGLYRQYPPDFFDLIIIDECHRGSAAGRKHLAGDPGILQARLPAWPDGDPQVRDERQYLRLFRRPSLHLQPAARDRRRLPGPLPRASDHHDVRRLGLAALPGRTRPLRQRNPGRRIPDQGFRAGGGPARPHQGHRQEHHRLPREERTVGTSRSSSASIRNMPMDCGGN